MTTAKKIDQKEYLKRYLPNDKDKKKKKKKKGKHAVGKSTVKIIDDDEYGSQFHHNVDESDLFALGEEAPQIVGIIDERPPELKAKEDFSTSKWKKLTVDSCDGWGTVNDAKPSGSKEPKGYLESFGKRDKGSPVRGNRDVRSRRRSFSDESPPRRGKEAKGVVDSDESPPRKRQQKTRRDSDQSPPRRNEKSKRPEYLRSPSRRVEHSDSDASPPRRKDKKMGKSPTRRVKKEYDSDQSPPRKNAKGTTRKNSVDSTPRRSRQDSNDCPPRRRTEHSSRRTSTSDPSPPRRKKETHSSRQESRRRSHSDESPPRRSQKTDRDQMRVNRERNASPSRSRLAEFITTRIKQEPVDSDESPPRRPNQSQRRSRSRDSDQSPPRRDRRNRRSPDLVRVKREPRDDEAEAGPSSSSGKMAKTLDGKRAGLQDARTLKVENEKFRHQENEIFEKMSAEVSGRYAKTTVREKYGKRKDIEEELRKEFEKRKRDDKKKEVYTRWGKGVKQVEDYKEQLNAAAHEMNKPLARYADDEDLDEHLRKQERIGDPMLEYIRTKRKEKSRQEGRPELPVYKGSFPDNRFGIRPGYRWDGVDRSNGFEKKWFEMTSKKKAGEEEAYKYSVEDM